MNLEEIRHLVAADRQAVDQLIIDSLHSDVALIEQIGHYIVNSGGKRLRPLLLLLSTLACGYAGKQHIDLAAIIEFIHTATLLHDDVVDASTLRRGRETANAIWNDHSSVLVGDFLYSRAFQMMVKVNNMQVMQVMADTTNIISEGEVLQLLNAHDPDTDEQRYFNVIQYKTAILFSASTKLAAIISQVGTELYQALDAYGFNFGIAYQLIDDALDYSAYTATMGKNVGDDLAEGKPTLPLIYLLQHGTDAQIRLVREAIEQGSLEHLDAIQQALNNSEAITYTKKLAQHYASKAIEALDILPASPYKEGLIGLANFIVQRNA